MKVGGSRWTDLQAGIYLSVTLDSSLFNTSRRYWDIYSNRKIKFDPIGWFEIDFYTMLVVQKKASAHAVDGIYFYKNKNVKKTTQTNSSKCKQILQFSEKKNINSAVCCNHYNQNSHRSFFELRPAHVYR